MFCSGQKPSAGKSHYPFQAGNPIRQQVKLPLGALFCKGYLFKRVKNLLSSASPWARLMSKPLTTASLAHHTVSQAAGGPDILSNCEILCWPCHEATPTFGR
jgi:hypothetical protein